MNRIIIDVHIFRFGGCQFGQKPAAHWAASCAAWLTTSPDWADPVHVAAWVHDLIFTMATPEHEVCDSHAGGCP